MKYDVKARASFNGIITVEAENWKEAKELLRDCTATGSINKINSPNAEKWEFGTTPIISIGKAKQKTEEV